MLEPIVAQLQQNMIRSVLCNLHSWWNGMLTGGHSRGSTLQAQPSVFDGMIEAAADRYGLDSALLKAVVQVESGFSPSAISGSGAKGLMQLMDNTARQMGVIDSFDPAQNIKGGARFLREMLDRFGGDTARALAAYNAGPGAVDRWGGIPPYKETQAYIPRVLDLRDKYHEWIA